MMATGHLFVAPAAGFGQKQPVVSPAQSGQKQTYLR